MLQTTGSDRKSFCGPLFGRGFSPREARRRAFIAYSTGWAGFSVKPNPEEDGDEAAQAVEHGREVTGIMARSARAAARHWEPELRVDGHRRNELSFEALTDLGVEFADPASLQFDEDGEAETTAFVRDQFAAAGMEYREDDESEGDDEDGWPDEDDYRILRSSEETEQFVAEKELEPKRNKAPLGPIKQSKRWARRQNMTVTTVSRDAARQQRAEARKRRANSVEGTAVRHADYGIFVQSGRDVGLVHVDTIRGHGSRVKALAFLHGHAVGTKVRVIPGAYRESKRRWDLELA